MEKRTIPAGFTMKRTITGSNLFRDWKKYDIGDILIGTIVGQKKDDNYGHISPIVKVEYADFKDGTGKNYIGKNLLMNKTTVTESGFIDAGVYDKEKELYSTGRTYQFEYQGTSKNTKGKFIGKDSHIVAITEVDTTPSEANATDDL